jgi:hypothetical protein
LVLVVVLLGGSLSKGSAVAAAPSPLQQTGISSDSEKRQRRQQQAAAKAQVENDKGQEQQQDEASATEEAKEPDNDFENQGWVKGLRGLRNYSVTGEELCLWHPAQAQHAVQRIKSHHVLCMLVMCEHHGSWIGSIGVVMDDVQC